MTRSNILLIALTAAVTSAIVAGLASVQAATNRSTLAPLSAAEAVQNAYVGVFKQVSPSVVQIQTSEGLGSGIVFDSKGDIVTNDHVVGNAKTFTVTTTTASQPLKGTLVGTFPEDDLAVIKVDSTSLKPA